MFGVPGFNEVRLKQGSREMATILSRPLVAVSRHGEGRTVAFTGFTPVHDLSQNPYLLDQQFFEDPATEAYFELFALLIAEACGQAAATDCDRVLAMRREPLFETLKKLPLATLRAPEHLVASASGKDHQLRLTLLNGPNYARLIRVRAEWDEGEPDVALYSDNYFDLLPQEIKSLEVAFRSGGERPRGRSACGRLLIEGTNVRKGEVQIELR